MKADDFRVRKLKKKNRGQVGTPSITIVSDEAASSFRQLGEAMRQAQRNMGRALHYDLTAELKKLQEEVDVLKARQTARQASFALRSQHHRGRGRL